MSNIGLVRYKVVGGYDLESLKQIDLTNTVKRESRVQVYPQDDGTFCLLFSEYINYGLIQVTIDKDKKIISSSKSG